jgi:hypothetical protein
VATGTNSRCHPGNAEIAAKILACKLPLHFPSNLACVIITCLNPATKTRARSSSASTVYGSW